MTLALFRVSGSVPPVAQWFRIIRIAKNPEISIGPLAHPFTHTPLIHLLCLHCSFCLRAPLCSFVHWLIQSPARGIVIRLLFLLCFLCVLDHSASVGSFSRPTKSTQFHDANRGAWNSNRILNTSSSAKARGRDEEGGCEGARDRAVG